MSAKRRNVNVVDYEMVTALGANAETSWKALLAGKTALAPDARFYPSDAAQCYPVGKVVAADATDEPEILGRSRFMRIVTSMLPTICAVLPADAKLILATTIGETDLLENGAGLDGAPRDTLSHVRDKLGLERPGLLLSAACASSTAALAMAGQWIASGRESCVCVLGCDALSEFAYSGFLSLQALSAGHARPFASDRDGLNLGEGAGYMLLMSDERMDDEKRWCCGRVEGWGMSGDAWHATSPDPEGNGLARAIRAALNQARLAPKDIASICAHGTATPFNDAMEERAFATVFNNKPPPLFSVKGAIGHTLGAAGVIEAIFALLASRDERVPPTAGNVGLSGQRVSEGAALTTNSGFGGINAALVLQASDDDC